MRIERLPIGDIKVIAKRHRPVVQKRVQLIAASITAIGLIYPIVVHVGKDGPVLDQGQHRLEAAKSLGWKRIRCLVSEGDKTKRRLGTVVENYDRAELTSLQRAEHTVERERLFDQLREGAQNAQPGGRQPKDTGLSKGAKALGISRDELRRARSIAAMSPEAKAKAIELKLDRKQSALLEMAKEDTAADQIAKANEIAARNRRATNPLAAKATERHRQKHGALRSTSPAKTSVDPAPRAESSDARPSTQAQPPEGRSLVSFGKPASRAQSRVKFEAAVRELVGLAAKPSEDFVGVVPTDDLEMVTNFLLQIAGASKAAE